MADAVAVIAAGAFAASRGGRRGRTQIAWAGTGRRDDDPQLVHQALGRGKHSRGPGPDYRPPMVAVVTPPATPSTAPGGAVGSCDQDIDQLGEPSVHGASVTAQRTTGPATTWLYETKTAWIVCDDLTASDGGAPTLFAPHNEVEAVPAA